MEPESCDIHIPKNPHVSASYWFSPIPLTFKLEAGLKSKRQPYSTVQYCWQLHEIEIPKYYYPIN